MSYQKRPEHMDPVEMKRYIQMLNELETIRRSETPVSCGVCGYAKNHPKDPHCYACNSELCN